LALQYADPSFTTGFARNQAYFSPPLAQILVAFEVWPGKKKLELDWHGAL
jgi:hypothetical protein